MKPYYSDESVTIYHGDCREVLPVECDLIVSDPPYGVNVDTGKLDRLGIGGWHSVEHAGDDWHSLILDQGKPTLLFGGNSFASKLPDHPGWIVWDKQTDGFTVGSPAELAWSNFLKNIRMFRLNYRGFTTRRDPKQHPMQKPLALMRWILTLAETPEGTVLDPFMGAGSTLRAAKDVGRKSIGIEIEERYCEISASRLSQSVLPLWEEKT